MPDEHRAPFRILVVEDNPADVDLVREALVESGVECRIATVADGFAALAYLRKEGAYAGAPRPDLILLDLNLAGMNGLDLLARLKADEALRSIPVVIMSSSTAVADVVRSYDLQANCYVVKPGELSEYFDAIRRLERFWLRTDLALRDPG